MIKNKAAYFALRNSPLAMAYLPQADSQAPVRRAFGSIGDAVGLFPDQIVR